jgi:2-dehydropantoate 2-reductase
MDEPVKTPISSRDRATIAVIGLGRVGSVVAACLKAAGKHDVIACARTHVGRFVLDLPDGSLDVDIPTLIDPREAKPVDWVLLCTKTHQTPTCLPWLTRLCHIGTRVAVLQNGIDHSKRVQPFVGGAVVVPTVVYYNGERASPDHVILRHVSGHDMAVPDDENGRLFSGLFQGTPLSVLVSGDFPALAWRKLLINVVANPITALTLRRQDVLRRPDIKLLCAAVLEEAVAVARADGIRLEVDEAARTMKTLLSYPAGAGTSMYFDRVAGLPFEVEALTGAIVAGGEKHNVRTPLNGALLALLRSIGEATILASA